MANRKSNQGIFVILLTWRTTPYNHTTYAMDTIFQLTWSVIPLLYTQYGILTPLYKFLCLLSIHPLGHTTKTPLLWSYLGPSVLMPIYKPQISHCPYTISWGERLQGFPPNFHHAVDIKHINGACLSHWYIPSIKLCQILCCRSHLLFGFSPNLSDSIAVGKSVTLLHNYGRPMQNKKIRTGLYPSAICSPCAAHLILTQIIPLRQYNPKILWNLLHRDTYWILNASMNGCSFHHKNLHIIFQSRGCFCWDE